MLTSMARITATSPRWLLGRGDFNSPSVGMDRVTQTLLPNPRPDTAGVHVHRVAGNSEFDCQLVGRATLQHLPLEAGPRRRESRLADLGEHPVEGLPQTGSLSLVQGVVSRLIRRLLTMPLGLYPSPAGLF